MKPDYMNLSDGRRVRVEFNMNALGDFTSRTGNDLSDLATKKADIPILKTLALCAISEGENIEGRKFDVDEIGLGRLMGMVEIVRFSEILAAQTNPGEQKKSEPPNRLKRIFYRKTGV